MNEVVWNGDGAMDYVRRRAAGFLTRAAITVARRAKELLSIPGTAKATGRGRQRKGNNVYGAVRSQPGEPPRKQTGRLRTSVTYEVDDRRLDARIGTNVEYGKHLELGTKRGLAPRPWLRRALDECRGRVNEFLSQLGRD